MNWKPVKHTVVNDEAIQNTLLNVGYIVAGNIGKDKVLSLNGLYEISHQFKSEKGGMFYSLYSRDIDYRVRVDKEISNILKPFYDSIFSDYKTVINSFIVKVAGPGSDFTLHQDSTGLDEYKYSPLSAWIPLQDTTLENGTLCLIPKTHRFFHPYRGISFATPFAEYENVLRKYLVPINLKAGDVLLFDNRLVHYSHLNSSETERVVVMSGIFPKEAAILSVYKDEGVADSPIEIYRQSEDFLITNTAFYENCTARPYRGEIIQKITKPLEKRTVYDFMSWASKEQLVQTNIEELINTTISMNIISEPV